MFGRQFARCCGAIFMLDAQAETENDSLVRQSHVLKTIKSACGRSNLALQLYNYPGTTRQVYLFDQTHVETLCLSFRCIVAAPRPKPCGSASVRFLLTPEPNQRAGFV